MLDLSLRIANMTPKDCTVDAVLEIIKESGHIPNAKGDYNLYFRDGEKIIFLSVDDFSVLAAARHPDNSALPSDKNYHEVLWGAISNIQAEIRFFFDAFNNGDVPIEAVQSLYDELDVKTVLIENADNKWLPHKAMDANVKTLRNHLLATEIVWPFFKDRSEAFQRVRRCPECGKYFYAKDIRKIFCSQDCKGANFYRLKKKKQK